jgi:hypothetical protein
MTLQAIAVYVGQALGIQRSTVSIATSVAFAVTSFFYIYTFASYVKVVVSVLHNFYNYIGYFNLYIFSKNTDHLIIALGMSVWLALSIRKTRARFVISGTYSGLALVVLLTKLDAILDILALLSIPLLISLLALNRFVPKTKILSKHVDTEISTNYIIILGFIISIAGLIASLTPFLSSVSSTPIRNYSYELFVLLSSSFAPLLLSLLILCIPVKLLLLLFNRVTAILRNKVKKNSEKNRARPLTSHYVLKNNGTNRYNNNKTDSTYKISRTKTILYLLLCMGLSASLALIPHQKAVNPDGRSIGVDTPHYVTAIKRLASYSDNPEDLILHAFLKEPPFYGDRPISLLLFFGLVKMVPIADQSEVVDHLPIVLGPALVLVVYFLTREMTSNDLISVLAAFLTAVSFHVLTGIYAGLYANWFALIIGFLSFMFLFKFLKRPNISFFVTYFVLVIFLLLSHVYTWSMLVAVTALFLIVMLKLNYYGSRRNLILLLLVILSPVLIDVIRTSTTGSIRGISFAVEFSQSDLGFKQLASFRANLLDTTQHWLGGLFGNFIILALAFYWLLKADHRSPHNIFIMIFLSVGIIPLLFSGWTLQTRVFYNIPFQIPAAIGLYYIIKQEQKKGIMILLPICIWLIAISIVALSNFYPIAPQQGS